MARMVGELQMVVSRLIEIHTFERAVDRQDFFGFVVGFGDKISGLTFCKTDNPGRGGVDIERG